MAQALAKGAVACLFFYLIWVCGGVPRRYTQTLLKSTHLCTYIDIKTKTTTTTKNRGQKMLCFWGVSRDMLNKWRALNTHPNVWMSNVKANLQRSPTNHTALGDNRTPETRSQRYFSKLLPIMTPPHTHTPVAAQTVGSEHVYRGLPGLHPSAQRLFTQHVFTFPHRETEWRK